jgi:Polysaccharide deacetylase
MIRTRLQGRNVLKEILRSAFGLFYLSCEMITKKTLNGLDEVLRSLSLWPRAALVSARILKSTAFMFSLLPGLEATNVGSLNNEQESMLGRGIRPMNEVVRGAPGRRQIALTFDAGAGADALPELLAALRHASVKCTFFLSGEWVQRYPNALYAVSKCSTPFAKPSIDGAPTYSRRFNIGGRNGNGRVVAHSLGP